MDLLILAISCCSPVTLLRHYRKMLTLTTILTLTLLLILTLILTLMFQYNFWMYYGYFQNSLVITVILKDDGMTERRDSKVSN